MKLPVKILGGNVRSGVEENVLNIQGILAASQEQITSLFCYVEHGAHSVDGNWSGAVCTTTIYVL